MYRTLIVTSHPVQYAAPIFRQMAQNSQIDITVAYCSLQGAKKGFDRGFGIEVRWDIPLLDGYPWKELSNQSFNPSLGNFWGLLNLELWKTIRTGDYDAIVILTGYMYASFWIALLAAKTKKIPVLFNTDAHEINPKDPKKWKTKLKKLLLPLIFDLADRVIVVSSGGVRLMKSLGISEEKIQLAPFVVDNQWWLSQVKQTKRNLTKQHWNIPENSMVILFCAKLQPWKSPQDLLLAFVKANLSQVYLVFAGEGPLRNSLEEKAKELNISEKVRFIGFVNQSQLPSVYSSADLFVLPSKYEPFGLVVNEAMLCGCPVVVSDRVGASYDLIDNGKNGFVYPCGDIDALAKILVRLFDNRFLLKPMGEISRERMVTWSPSEKVNSIVQGVEKAIATKS